MPRVLALFAILFVIGDAAAEEREVKIGTKVDDLRFKDIRYLARSLADFGEKKAFVLVFVDSDCPLAQKYLPVLDRLERELPRQGRAVRRRQRRARTTPSSTMAAQAVEFGVEFPFVKDADCRVADALGVTRTPEVAVLDGKRRPALPRPDRRPVPPRRPAQGADAARPGRGDRRGPRRQAGRGRDDPGGRLPHHPADDAGRAKSRSRYADHVAPILQQHCQRATSRTPPPRSRS